MPLMIQDFLSIMKSIASLLRAHFWTLLVAALVPFVCSHLIVLQARHIGLPYRLALDLAHGMFVVSYLGTVTQMEFQGLARFGLAVPRLGWLGLKPLVLALLCVLVIGFPAAFVLHPLTQGLEALASMRGGAWAFVPTVMVPEFIMTTLIGLALAAVRGKIQS